MNSLKDIYLVLKYLNKNIFSMIFVVYCDFLYIIVSCKYYFICFEEKMNLLYFTIIVEKHKFFNLFYNCFGKY